MFEQSNPMTTKQRQPAAIAALTDLISKLGFRPSGTTLHRLSHDERVIQVVTLQKGRTRLIGKFTVELGCFLPSVYASTTDEPPPKRPSILQCHIRDRLTHFIGLSDLWWKSDDLGETEMLAVAARRDIPLFFERFGEVHAILEASPERPLPMGSPYVRPVLLHEEGRDGEAREYIQRWRDGLIGKSRDASFLADFETRIGLDPRN